MEELEGIFITSSLSTINNNAVGYQVINFSDMPYTLPADTHITENTGLCLNQQMKTNQSSGEQETYKFPTLEQPGDPETYTLIQKLFYDEILELKQL